jgi:hypothetical protein
MFFGTGLARFFLLVPFVVLRLRRLVALVVSDTSAKAVLTSFVEEVVSAAAVVVVVVVVVVCVEGTDDESRRASTAATSTSATPANYYSMPILDNNNETTTCSDPLVFAMMTPMLPHVRRQHVPVHSHNLTKQLQHVGPTHK